jgi:hypothetical protein
LLSLRRTDHASEIVGRRYRAALRGDDDIAGLDSEILCLRIAFDRS